MIVIQKGGRVVIQDICIAIQDICLVVLDICIVILDIRIVIQEDLMDITIKDHIVIQGEVIVVVGEKKNIQSVKMMFKKWFNAFLYRVKVKQYNKKF